MCTGYVHGIRTESSHFTAFQIKNIFVGIDWNVVNNFTVTKTCANTKIKTRCVGHFPCMNCVAINWQGLTYVGLATLVVIPTLCMYLIHALVDRRSYLVVWELSKVISWVVLGLVGNTVIFTYILPCLPRNDQVLWIKCAVFWLKCNVFTGFLSGAEILFWSVRGMFSPLNPIWFPDWLLESLASVGIGLPTLTLLVAGAFNDQQQLATNFSTTVTIWCGLTVLGFGFSGAHFRTTCIKLCNSPRVRSTN